MAFWNKDDKDSVDIQDIEIPPPFPCLALIPNLLIDDVQVDFQMEVTATESTTENNKEASPNSNFKFGCIGGSSVNLSGKVSSSRGNTSSTNQ